MGVLLLTRTNICVGARTGQWAQSYIINGSDYAGLPSSSPWSYKMLTIVDGKSKRKRVHPGFAWMRWCKSSWTRGSSSTKMHIRIYRIPACSPLERLPPTQTRGIPSIQGKTAVAQMHFASEPPCPRVTTVSVAKR